MIYHEPENISGTNLSRCRFTTVIRRASGWVPLATMACQRITDF
jgi:hypothetical protein